MTIAAAGAALPAFPATMRRPRALRPGDRVGLISPASPLSDGELVQSIEHVRSLGLEPVVGRYAGASTGYLAGTDEQRASDFNVMARDPAIRGIIATRGGYGTMRILDALDYGAIANDPKVIVGFSDVTALLNAVALRSGVVTFHGPLAGRLSKWDSVTRGYFERICMSARPPGTLVAPDAHVLASGQARGRIAGGNLSLVCALIGTPWSVPFGDALLVLEDVEEQPYRIDRMLTQLRLAGAFRAARGVLFGACTDCRADGPSLSADEVLADRLGHLDRPVLAGVPVGHIPEQWVMPIGIEARLDATNRRLELLEPAVLAA